MISWTRFFANMKLTFMMAALLEAVSLESSMNISRKRSLICMDEAMPRLEGPLKRTSAEIGCPVLAQSPVVRARRFDIVGSTRSLRNWNLVHTASFRNTHLTSRYIVL